MNEQILKISDFLGYWPGFDYCSDNYIGNSILIQISKQEYIHIGQNMYTYKTDDTIIDYASPIGCNCNNVIHPIAFGTNNIYFMLDQLCIKKLI